MEKTAEKTMEKTVEKTVEKTMEPVLKGYSKLIEPAIIKILTSGIDGKFKNIVGYQILTGGKRLRPFLTIISCRLLGGKSRDAILPAAGIEILHNYLLIVDDIIDHSILRRGKPTSWFKFGKSIAECIAVDYSAAIFQAASFSKEPVKLSRLFAETLKTISDGEILDILFEQKGREEEPFVKKSRYRKINESDYLKMAGRKTAFLFKSSCRAGGIAAGAKEKEIKTLADYGFNLGIAFQISDDILDIFGEEGTFGKQIGKDIRERKMGNIIILYAMKELNSQEKKRFLEILGKEKMTKKDIKEGVGLIKKTNAQKKAISLGEKFVRKARFLLNSLPQNRWNKVLRETADSILMRRK